MSAIIKKTCVVKVVSGVVILRCGYYSSIETWLRSSSLSRVRTFFMVLLLPLREDFLERMLRPVPRRSLRSSAAARELGLDCFDRRRDMTRPPSLSEEES